MKLPHANEAAIPRKKITGYLLSANHPLGREKLEFFQSFGFESAEWEVFEKALRAHAIEHEVAAMQDTQYGTRYIVEGNLKTPDGRHPLVRVVWFISKPELEPRFVTAYPLRRKP